MRNAKLDAWVEEVASLTTPDRVQWCDGSTAEHDEMIRLLVHAGTATPLNDARRPGSVLVRSHPADVARVEDRTFNAVDTPIGRLPAPGALDVDGLPLRDGAMDELLAVDVPGWLEEVGLIREHFARFGDRLPSAMAASVDQLEARLLEVRAPVGVG